MCEAGWEKRREKWWHIHSRPSPCYAWYRRLSHLALEFLFLHEIRKAMSTSYSFSSAVPEHSGHFLNLCSDRQQIRRLHISGTWSGPSGSLPSLSQSILSCCLPVIHWAGEHISLSFFYYSMLLPSCFSCMMRPMHGHTTFPSSNDMALIQLQVQNTFFIFPRLSSRLLLPFLQ